MQPSQFDLQTPFDPTAYTSITGAQLEQFGSGIYPYSDKGLIVITQDVAGSPTVPNASTTVKWQNYMWLRQEANSVTAYIWNPNGASDPTYLNWVTVSSASIAPGSITGSQIANSTITASNIASILGTQVTGVNPAWLATPSGAGFSTNGLLQNTTAYPSGGLLGGTYGAPTLANASIGPGVLTAQSVTGNGSGGTLTNLGNIIEGTVSTFELVGNGGERIAIANQTNTGAVDPQYNIMVSSKTLISGSPSGANFNPFSTGQNVVAGDLLAVNYQSSQPGFVQVRKAIVSLVEPTASNATAQVPTVPANTAASGGIVPYSLVNPQGANGGAPFGRLLQKVQFTNTTKKASSGTISTGSTPNYNATGVTSFFSDTFTPLSASSTLFVRAVMMLYNGSSAFVYGGIYAANGATAPTAFNASSNTANCLCPLIVEGNFAPGAVTTITFYLGFGTNSGTAYTNSQDGSTAVFGGLYSSLTIEEYL